MPRIVVIMLKILVILLGMVAVCSAYEVVYALNAGGRDFVDSFGIEYEVHYFIDFYC